MAYQAYKKDGTEVVKGDTITSFRGDEYTLYRILPTKVEVQTDNGVREFFHGVFGLTVVNEEEL